MRVRQERTAEENEGGRQRTREGNAKKKQQDLERDLNI